MSLKGITKIFKVILWWSLFFGKIAGCMMQLWQLESLPYIIFKYVAEFLNFL